MSETISTLKNGNKVLIEKQPYLILETEFVNPGKGQAFTRIKIKNLINNKIVFPERDFIHVKDLNVLIVKMLSNFKKYSSHMIYNVGSGKPTNIKKLILASSMSVYGEGSYIDNNGDISFPEERKENDLINLNWDFDGYTPIPTKEEKPLKPSSIYALNKRDQEENCLCIGKTYNIPTLAFRMFNVYGPYQALSNPYTGVVAIFSSRILSNKSPIIYEDGLQMRDFVYVEDVANAYIDGLEKDFKGQHILNLGSGEQINIYDVAKELSKILVVVSDL